LFGEGVTFILRNDTSIYVESSIKITKDFSVVHNGYKLYWFTNGNFMIAETAYLEKFYADVVSHGICDIGRNIKWFGEFLCGQILLRPGSEFYDSDVNFRACFTPHVKPPYYTGGCSAAYFDKNGRPALNCPLDPTGSCFLDTDGLDYVCGSLQPCDKHCLVDKDCPQTVTNPQKCVLSKCSSGSTCANDLFPK